MKHAEPQPEPKEIDWHRLGLVWLGAGIALCAAALGAQRVDYQERLRQWENRRPRWTDANRWERG